MIVHRLKNSIKDAFTCKIRRWSSPKASLDKKSRCSRGCCEYEIGKLETIFKQMNIEVAKLHSQLDFCKSSARLTAELRDLRLFGLRGCYFGLWSSKVLPQAFNSMQIQFNMIHNSSCVRGWIELNWNSKKFWFIRTASWYVWLCQQISHENFSTVRC